MQDYLSNHPPSVFLKDKIILSKKDILYNYFSDTKIFIDELKPLVKQGLIKIKETPQMLIIDIK